ncbi:hypothetical protein TNCT6_76290 [Streptomyces sp. 6-11-2]|nr:hypothetical protein TNCT6_76290 [Streptomyces sp. 6-11-2]
MIDREDRHPVVLRCRVAEVFQSWQECPGVGDVLRVAGAVVSVERERGEAVAQALPVTWFRGCRDLADLLRRVT